jgi:hypothetical protein
MPAPSYFRDVPPLSPETAELVRLLAPSREDRLADAVEALTAEVAALRAELHPPSSLLITGREAEDAYRALRHHKEAR